MATSITDEEWNELYDSFETTKLLSAVDAVDVVRQELSDDENCTPAPLRTDLLRLHQLAMDVFNDGSRSQVEDLFNFAIGLEAQVFGIMTALEQVKAILSELTALYPESLSYGTDSDE
jgi:hypothetical protein